MTSRGSTCSAQHVLLMCGLLLAGSPGLFIEIGSADDTRPAHLKEHTITIDATGLVPPSWWQISGITPSIWASDPESLDAPKTSERRDLRLKPGHYKFVSFTFDFPFSVTLEGTIQFPSSLDQCIGGRGTQTLIVRCKRMYPYGGERDHYYDVKQE